MNALTIKNIVSGSTVAGQTTLLAQGTILDTCIIKSIALTNPHGSRTNIDLYVSRGLASANPDDPLADEEVCYLLPKTMPIGPGARLVLDFDVYLSGDGTNSSKLRIHGYGAAIDYVVSGMVRRN